MDFVTIYLVMIACFVAGIVVLPVLRHNLKIANFLAHGMATLGSAAAVLCASFVFVTGPQAFTLPVNMTFLAISVRVDYLAAYFLAIIGIVGAAASVYAVAYGQEYFNRRFKAMAALYLAFLLSMVLVVTVSHIVLFLVIWELMTVTSFLLVGQDYQRPASTRAAYLYFVMTHVGTVFIIIAFLLVWQTSASMEFAALTAARADDWVRNAIFVCSLIGFGTKAGMIPLHIWLPEAHPAAPTHVSALMSGVMIKTAIYGMCRFYLEFLGVGPVWWGVVILVLAIVSAVLGVLYALMEHDVKSLLAYHSVENIGIILLGVGAGMVFMSAGLPALAGLAWAAALFHVLNHAVFKSLLFLGAGAVINATHVRDIEHLGGLIKNMPYTAVFFLTGAAAISALPPLNGFVSEWLTFQSLFILPEALTGVLGKISSAALVSLLGLTGALAAACFVKAFGIIFLAKPRSLQAAKAREVPALMLVPMGFLAVLCLILGVYPAWMMGILQRVLTGFFRVGVLDHLVDTEWYFIGFQTVQSVGTVSLPALLLFLIAGLVFAAIVYRFNGSPGKVTAETWTCGIIPTARMEYTATGFSGVIRRAFEGVLRPRTETVIDHKVSPYSGHRMVFQVRITHVFINMFYRPINQYIVRLSRFMKTIQTGSVQLYIGYIMAVTVAVLLWSTRW